jgi:sphinganine-1-phosphate aldolase
VSPFAQQPADILARLSFLREADAPTHGGRVLSYVYDSGMAELDELAAAAMRLVQPVNGLDPTTFTSVPVMEREVVGFVRDLLGGDETCVGSVTTGGTESCLLAVKTARDLWVQAGGVGTPRLLAPVTVHAAFQKAAHYFGLELDLVPVLPSGAVEAEAVIGRMSNEVALVVVSAPSYAHAALDPIVEVAAAASAWGIACHVDACIGGLILPFWPGLPAWNLSVPGVTSISADLHKFGYAPKGVSVLLHRGRDRQRAQYFATTGWPGYPVVNSTMLGSKSAAPLAAAWAIISALGVEGFAALAESCEQATTALLETVSSIEGLRVIGDPVGRYSLLQQTRACLPSSGLTRTTGQTRCARTVGCFNCGPVSGKPMVVTGRPPRISR